MSRATSAYERVRLRRLGPDTMAAARDGALDAATVDVARGILDDVRRGGEAAVRAHAMRLDGLAAGAPLVLDPPALAAACREVGPEVTALLERTAARIARFAVAQRASLQELVYHDAGLVLRQHVAPVARAGCYAPGGRYPLPSSVLMTAVTARVAGVDGVVVATPRPTPVMLAAAHVAGADAVVAVGGAQAIGALAFGAGVPAVDLIVGPGNRFVTAAKQLVHGVVGVDLPAGPSELVVVADTDADARGVALDLLAQAEHDVDARVTLVVVAARAEDGACRVAAVEDALTRELVGLPTAAVAREALARAAAVLVPDIDAAVAVVDQLAPEHLELLVSEPEAVARRIRHFGAVFLGAGAGEVLGDYGAGPNHVLPTGGAARFAGGLSVLTFLRVRTSMARAADPRREERGRERGAFEELLADAAALARLEGLAAHARAAEWRRG